MRSMVTQPLPRKPASLLDARVMRADRAASSFASALVPCGDGCSTPVAAARLPTRESVSWSNPSMPAKLHTHRKLLMHVSAQLHLSKEGDKRVEYARRNLMRNMVVHMRKAGEMGNGVGRPIARILTSTGLSKASASKTMTSYLGIEKQVEVIGQHVRVPDVSDRCRLRSRCHLIARRNPSSTGAANPAS